MRQESECRFVDFDAPREIKSMMRNGWLGGSFQAVNLQILLQKFVKENTCVLEVMALLRQSTILYCQRQDIRMFLPKSRP